MSDPSGIAEHYRGDGLMARIEAALAAHGATPPLDIDTLALFDEFHIGGRAATQALLPGLAVTATSRVLDLGCGLGGPARFIARTTGARVTGIDLTPDFVAAAQALIGLALLLDRVQVLQGDVLHLPFADDSFDATYMIHVGMNIADKPALMRSVARVLKPGGRFVLYDVMARSHSAAPGYPVPWASSAAQSALAEPRAYRAALTAAGFAILSETDRSDLLRPPPAGASAQPLGLHLVMGPESGTKIANMAAAVRAGTIAPIEIVSRLAAPRA